MVVVLNGGSSSGKSSLARCLQDQLASTWMALGVDDLIRALPGGDRPVGEQSTIRFSDDGTVDANQEFRRAELAWYRGLAAIARCGIGLIVEEVFLSGSTSQRRLADALSDLPVLWVGVRCDADIAATREANRADRVIGMAHQQAEHVHDGVHYDLVVDTTATDAAHCARLIKDKLSLAD